MLRPTASLSSPLEALPEPEAIRRRLSALFVEARLLRRLLRLSESVSDEYPAERSDRREVAHA